MPVQLPVSFEQILPQRPPVVMIDHLVECSQNKAMAKLLVKEDNIFTRNGVLQTAGLTEMMAQTAAAKAGWKFFQAEKEGEKAVEPPVGFIGAISNLTIFNRPAIGSLLHCHIETTFEMDKISVVTASVFCGEKELAKGELKIFLH